MSERESKSYMHTHAVVPTIDITAGKKYWSHSHATRGGAWEWRWSGTHSDVARSRCEDFTRAPIEHSTAWVGH